MGYLAFDRDAVGRLTGAVDHAVTELSRLGPWDPASALEHNEVALAIRLVSEWTACLQSLSGCTALDAYRPIGPAAGDIEREVWRNLAAAAHLELVADPLGGDPHVDPYLRGASLAAVLRDDDLDELLTDDQLRWLDGELSSVLASPSGRWGFVDRMGTGELVDLCTRLADRQVDLDWHNWPTPDEHASSTAATISHLLAAIGAAVARRRDSGGATDPAEVTAALPPAVAAQLIAGMSLASDELAELTTATLERWWTAVDAPSATIAWARAPGDLLLPLVAADPETSRRFVALTIDRPELIFRTSRDKAAAGEIVLHAADPRAVDSADAGRIVPTILDHLRTAGDRFGGFDDSPGTDRAWLGTLAGDWLLELSDPPASWGWSLADGEAALRFVLDDDAALDRVIDRATQRLEDVAAGFPTDRAQAQRALEDLSRLTGQLDALVMQARLADAEAARFLWDLGWAVANVVAIGALGTINLPAGVAMSIAVEAGEAVPVAGMSAVRGFVERTGILPAPPSRAAVHHDLLTERDEVRAVQASAVVDAVFATMVAGGLAGSSLAPPPRPTAATDGSQRTVSETYLDDVHGWRDRLVASGRLDQDDADDLTLVLHTMLNPAQAGALGVEIRTAG